MTSPLLTLAHFIVTGAPRTKKNHGSVIQRGRRRFHIPSAAWTVWATTAKLEGYWKGITAWVNCEAHFYRDKHTGDAVGYYQGLADLLEKRGIVVNDKQIISWDGSRLLVDRERPRTEVILSEVIPLEDVLPDALNRLARA